MNDVNDRIEAFREFLKDEGYTEDRWLFAGKFAELFPPPEPYRDDTYITFDVNEDAGSLMRSIRSRYYSFASAEKAHGSSSGRRVYRVTVEEVPQP